MRIEIIGTAEGQTGPVTVMANTINNIVGVGGANGMEAFSVSEAERLVFLLQEAIKEVKDA